MNKQIRLHKIKEFRNVIRVKVCPYSKHALSAPLFAKACCLVYKVRTPLRNFTISLNNTVSLNTKWLFRNFKGFKNVFKLLIPIHCFFYWITEKKLRVSSKAQSFNAKRPDQSQTQFTRCYIQIKYHIKNICENVYSK